MSLSLINVGIADVKISIEQEAVLRTILGSCVGICLFDLKTRIAGMAHIMLPVQKEEESNKLKYADTAIPFLLSQLTNAGVDKKNLQAKIAGGASMFVTSEGSFMAEIGKRNIETVQMILADLHIPIIAEDVGGTRGRTIDLFVRDGRLRIKKFSEPEIFI